MKNSARIPMTSVMGGIAHNSFVINNEIMNNHLQGFTLGDD